eukprot:3691275-Rhodomonas_salina.1
MHFLVQPRYVCSYDHVTYAATELTSTTQVTVEQGGQVAATAIVRRSLDPTWPQGLKTPSLFAYRRDPLPIWTGTHLAWN